MHTSSSVTASEQDVKTRRNDKNTSANEKILFNFFLPFSDAAAQIMRYHFKPALGPMLTDRVVPKKLYVPVVPIALTLFGVDLELLRLILVP